MKKIKKIVGTFLIILLVGACGYFGFQYLYKKPVEEVSDWDGSTNEQNSSITITTYAGDVFDNVSLPSSIVKSGKKYSVVGVDFATNYDIVKLTLPITIKTIGDGCFNNWRYLKYVRLPNACTYIGDSAFNGTAIETIVIPNNVSFIGANAFSNCSSLQSITLGSGITKYTNALCCNCSALNNVYISNNIISIDITVCFSGSTNIQYKIENQCGYLGNADNEYLLFVKLTSSLTELRLNENTEVINPNAISGHTEITSLILPKNLREIPKEELEYFSNLQQIVVDSDNSFYSSLNNCLVCKSTKTIIKGTINSTIPTDATVTNIGDSAFYSCTDLTSITIPSNITSIGSYAFMSCGLTSIVIPQSVTSIGTNAFSSTNIANITLNNSIIGEYMFYGTKLTSVTIPSNITRIGNFAFLCCSDLETIIFNASCKVIPQHCFSGTKVSSLTIPNSVEKIDSYAFANCKSLTQINFGTGLTDISNNAFTACSALTELTFASQIETIGEFAFSNCEKLAIINLSSSLTTIGHDAFLYCGLLTNVCFSGSSQWYAGTTLLSAEQVASSTTMAEYLKSTYRSFEWTKA